MKLKREAWWILVVAILAVAPALHAQFVAPPPPDGAPLAGAPPSPEGIVTTLLGVVLAPMITQMLKRLSFVPTELGANLNLLVCLVLYVAAWALVGGQHGLPESPFTWLNWALVAQGIGVAGFNALEKTANVTGRRLVRGVALALLAGGMLAAGGCAARDNLTACRDAAATPAEVRGCGYAAAARELAAQAELHEALAWQIGRAQALGWITDAEAEAAADVARRAEAALRTARAALATAVAGDLEHDLAGATASAYALMRELAALAATFTDDRGGTE